MSSRFLIQRVAQDCRSGGVIAYPTEAVYGLGCDPLNQQAVYRLLVLKQRRVEKGLILLADSLEKLLPFILVTTDQKQKFLQAQVRPTTWLVPASDLTPFWIRGQHEKVAVRIARHPVAMALCAQLPWPLVSTSANPASRPAARTALQVRRYFSDQLDALLAGEVDRQARPSVIRDLETDTVLRT